MNHTCRLASTGLLALSALFMAGCLSHPQVRTPLHETPRGRVVLKTFPDAATRASHPRTLSKAVVTRFLEDLRVREDRPVLAQLVSGGATPLTVFSAEQQRLLAPWIRDGLARATPEEYVWFEVAHDGDGNPQTTAGAVYLLGERLTIALETFRLPTRLLSARSSSTAVRPPRWMLQTLTDRETASEYAPHHLGDYFMTWVTIPLEVLNVDREHAGGTTAEPSSSSSVSTSPATPTPPRDSGRARTDEKTRLELQRLQRTIDEQQRKLRELEQRIPALH